MFDVLIGAAALFVVLLVVLTYLGYGVARLILPIAFQQDTLLWSPPIGFALLGVVYHALNMTMFSGAAIAVILLLGVTAVNIAVVWRERGILLGDTRLAAGLYLLAASIYSVGLTPLIDIGELTTMARNYDLVDTYNASARYVLDGSIQALRDQGLPNPILNHILTPQTLSNGWNFTYLHAFFSFITFQDPLTIQSPLMGFVHALMIPALFIFFRRTLNLPALLSVLIAVALGTNGLLLFLAIFGLGNQAAILAVMPLAFASTVFAIHHPGKRSVTLAALLLSTLPLTYWAALLFYAAPIGIYIAVTLALDCWTILRSLSMLGQARARWVAAHLVRSVGAMVLIVVGSVILGYQGWYRLVTTMADTYLVQRGGNVVPLSEGWGDRFFIDTATLSGLAYWVWPRIRALDDLFGQQIGQIVTQVESYAFFGCFVLAAYGLWTLQRQPKILMGSMAVAYVAILAAFRFGAPYYYGYFKAVSFAAIAFVGLTSIGLYAAWRHRFRWRWLRGVQRIGIGAVGVTLGGLILLNGALTVSWFFDQPDTQLTGTILPPSLVRLRDVDNLVPTGAAVFIGPAPSIRPEVTSALAYFLKDHPLQGNVKTLLSRLDNQPAGGLIPDYAILSAAVDPTDYGYEPTSVLWKNAEIVLYQRANTIANVFFGDTNALAISDEKPLQVSVTSAGLSFGSTTLAAETTATPTVQLSFEIAALRSQTIDLEIDGQSRPIAVPAGLVRYSLESRAYPFRVSIRPARQQEVYVRRITVKDVVDVARGPEVDTSALVLVPKVSANDQTASITIDYAVSDSLPAGMNLGLSLGGTTRTDKQWVELGWWGTDLRPDGIQLDLDVSTLAVTAEAAGARVRVNQRRGEIVDGTFTATINVWHPGLSEAGWNSGFFDLLNVDIRQQRAVDWTPVAQPLFVVPLRYGFPASPDTQDRFAADVAAIDNAIPSGSPVFLSSALLSTPDALTAIIAGLSDRQLSGHFIANARPVRQSHVYEYAVLSLTDDPRRFGYQSRNRIWSGPTAAVYRRGETVAHLETRNANGYQRIGASPLRVAAGADWVVVGQAGEPLDNPRDTATRQLVLTFAALDQAVVEIQTPTETRTVRLAGGITTFTTPALDPDAAVNILTSGTEPVFLTAVDLIASSQAAGSAIDPNIMVVRVDSRAASPTTLAMSWQWAVAGGDRRDYWLGFLTNGYTLADQTWIDLGWAAVAVPLSGIQATLDLPSREIRASAAGQPVPVTARQNTGTDGWFSVQASLWEQDLVANGWRAPFLNLAEYRVEQGRVIDVVPKNSNIVLISLLPPS